MVSAITAFPIDRSLADLLATAQLIYRETRNTQQIARLAPIHALQVLCSAPAQA
jgi:hypothetical protein